MTATIDARCADHIGEPFVRRCADCDAEQRDLDAQLQTERAKIPELQMRSPDEMRAMRVSDVLRALRNERRDGYLPEFTAADWEAAARHLHSTLERQEATSGRR